MICLDKKDWLYYLRSDLDDNRRREIEEHLNQCSRCRELSGEYARVYNTLDSMEGLEPATGFPSRVRQAAAARHQIKSWKRVMLPALATAAAAASLIAGIFLGQSLFQSIQIEDTPQQSQTGANMHYEGTEVEFYNQGG